MSRPTAVAVINTFRARGHWHAKAGLKVMIGSSSIGRLVRAGDGGSVLALLPVIVSPRRPPDTMTKCSSWSRPARVRPPPELADAHQAADHEHQHGERLLEHALGNVCGSKPAPAAAPPMAMTPKVTPRASSTLPRSLRCHGADQ